MGAGIIAKSRSMKVLERQYSSVLGKVRTKLNRKSIMKAQLRILLLYFLSRFGIHFLFIWANF